MKLTLIRGLPGSGKTTLAEVRADEGALHLEGDQYFQVQDEYFFTANLIRDAHKRCRELTRIALSEGFDVVVSNTFTTRGELQPYLDMAEDFGSTVDVVTCTSDFGSVHNVPETALKAMKNRWEDIPGERFFYS